MSKTLIIGQGEIGKSLFEVLKPHHEIYICDKENFNLFEE